MQTVNLKDRFRDLLIGFEEFSFTEEQIKALLPDFDLALRDYNCCLACKVGRNEKARCKTSVGTMSYKGYMALYKNGCTIYKKPSFAIHDCPGPVVRRELIAQAKIARREEPLFAGNTDRKEEPSPHYTDR